MGNLLEEAKRLSSTVKGKKSDKPITIDEAEVLMAWVRGEIRNAAAVKVLQLSASASNSHARLCSAVVRAVKEGKLNLRFA